MLFGGLDLPAGFVNPAIVFSIWFTKLIAISWSDVITYILVEVWGEA